MIDMETEKKIGEILHEALTKLLEEHKRTGYDAMAMIARPGSGKTLMDPVELENQPLLLS